MIPRDLALQWCGRLILLVNGLQLLLVNTANLVSIDAAVQLFSGVEYMPIILYIWHVDVHIPGDLRHPS